MAVFTIELGALIAQGYNIGLGVDDYPIFDEAYRPILNQMIIDKFEFREIGQETPRLFKKFLNRKMRQIMPYYNKLYESTLIDFDPLLTQVLDSTTTNDTKRTGSASETSVGDSKNKGTGRTLVSTTPQTQLVSSEDYASGLTDSVSEGDTQTSGESTTQTADEMLNTYVHHAEGYSDQSPSDAIMKYRLSLINVNLMVLGELETLFMGIWDSQIGGF